jgi:toxin FitB
VARWLDEVDEGRVHLSVITLGGLREGVDRTPHGRRRAALDRRLRDDLPDRFAGRVLPVDAAVAQRWGELRAAGASTGRRSPSSTASSAPPPRCTA